MAFRRLIAAKTTRRNLKPGVRDTDHNSWTERRPMPEDEPEDTRDRFLALPRGAQAYLVGLSCLAAGLLVQATGTGLGPGMDWPLLALLVVLCAAGALFEIFAPGHYALQPSFAFFFWGSLLLPPWGIAILAIASFGPDLVSRQRTALYKAIFNVSNYLLAGIAAWGIVTLAGGPDSFTDRHGAFLAAMGLAALMAPVVNHLLLTAVVALATGTRPRRMLHQLVEGTPLSMGIALMGACLAALWLAWEPLVLLGIGPVGMVSRALYVPMLRHRANTDPKTGLLHLDAFTEAFQTEFASTQRTGAPLTIVMIDLDHLRAINNTCGHLTGDRVIRGVADALSDVCPDRGHAARFGGEEFCMLLPGHTVAQAQALMATMREELLKIDFRESSEAPELRVTFSGGIAVYPEHGSGLDELLAAADQAVYDAKAAGRDRVRVALSDTAKHALELPADPVREPAPVEISITGPATVRPPATVSSALAQSSADARLRAVAEAAADGAAAASTPSSTPERRETDRKSWSLIRRVKPLEDVSEAAAVRLENRQLRGLLADTQDLLRRMQGSYLTTITSMAKAIEAKDPFSGDHTDQVARFTVRLGEKVGFAGADLRALEMGATIHDIGKIGVTDSVLHKEGTLSAGEEDAMRRHPEMGSRILADLELPVIVKQMVRSHHERFDGSGYPDGIAGEEIPLAARVLAVADALNAMLSERPYRGAMSFEDAYAEIMSNRGTQFCPRVVDALAASWGEDPMFWSEDRTSVQLPSFGEPVRR
jgi:diguanylate cyclase (GGDEF)-like protein